MAKKYWDGDITLNTDWGGDESTNNLPVIGEKVQKVIKDNINSKVGYVGRVDKTGKGFYVLCRDKETFELFLQTVTDSNPFGDTQMDGVNGTFDAPFNHKMEINVLNPSSGYQSVLSGTTGNIVKFTARTLDISNNEQLETLNISIKVITEGGVESNYRAIYTGEQAKSGIEYNLDSKLGNGVNTIVITATGMDTGASAIKRITYCIVDISFSDNFNIANRYQYGNNGIMEISFNYSLKGIGETTLFWYFDNSEPIKETLGSINPVLQNQIKKFTFNQGRNQNFNIGKHTIQMVMECRDIETNDVFRTPILYREFIVENYDLSLSTPYIVRKATLPSNMEPLTNDIITINNAKQYENIDIEYAIYYAGKRECNVEINMVYDDETINISSEKINIVKDGFSNIQKRSINLEKEGEANVVITAKDNDTIITSTYRVVIAESTMDIGLVTNDLVLSLTAFGRSNSSADRESWDYTYKVNGEEKTIRTKFYKNEYFEIIPPSDSTDSNTLETSSLPSIEREEYKYIKCNNKYYVWAREFDWSNTSGWADNKLKLAKGNAITIQYAPFKYEKGENGIKNFISSYGGTFEFEFETTNVYNDDAVICRICGNETYAPGITIYASGAELVISRDIVNDSENINSGYMKAVSTKYKPEESNRVSFVITPNLNEDNYRNRILKIYVNGELCGAYPYDPSDDFTNNSEITFRSSEDACVNISSIQIYQRDLNSNEILKNYIYFRSNTNEKTSLYKRNDIMLDSNKDNFDNNKLKSQLPVMVFYEIPGGGSLDDIHQEVKNKKLTRFFDVVYTDIQNPDKNFVIKNAYVTPQGTSSMNYPVKNLRLYTGKKDDDKRYHSRLFVGPNIFENGNSLDYDNLNEAAEVTERLYSFRDATIGQKMAAPVNCWCLKADFAESSSSHNTGTARFWNNVLKTAGYTTKAQKKAAANDYPYDVRTCIDGFPIAVFYQPLNSPSPRFEGKYNFNNDKSTEDVFGFTSGENEIIIENQNVEYFYIGTEKPIIQTEKGANGAVEYKCTWAEGGYTENPTEDSPLYVSKNFLDGTEEWYMLRTKNLLDNPKMECWEILNSVNDIALFKTVEGFSVSSDGETIGYTKGDAFEGAFESRYPDCGDYYHYNSLKRFAEWLVSCRYLKVDRETGESVPYTDNELAVEASENYHIINGKLSICSLTKQDLTITMDFPGKNFYKEVPSNTIQIKGDGYEKIALKAPEGMELEDFIKELENLSLMVDSIPSVKATDADGNEYNYIKLNNDFYVWTLGNTLQVEELPNTHNANFEYLKILKEDATGDEKDDYTYYKWDNTFNLKNYHPDEITGEPKVWVEDTAFNRALKFAIEKYDHIDMEKMAAYYIYLMRFGGVDQTVKNAMLTTEGPATKNGEDDPTSKLPSLWFFINYDNDTILGVKNDGRLVFGPYITRQTKDGDDDTAGYVYAGRESTLWNNLENDTQFMQTVTKVDNVLAKGEGSSTYSLSYNNAIREYDNNQSDKWCERIYNKDAERKYINTWVNGWVKHDSEENIDETVYEDYLYDVHGSRSAHRKWWLGRRFNVYDSRFCNDNFRKTIIKFRSTNLPAGSSFTIKSGEPIFYAWGHDNSVTEMTPNVVQPGDEHTFVTQSTFNIGSYLELMGAPNISSLDLRECVGALSEIDINGCNSSSIGTKLNTIMIGDHNRTDLINNPNAIMKFSGLQKATKLEYLDVTNIANIFALDGLDTLTNIRELYAKGTRASNFTFAPGSAIEKVELPNSVEFLSLVNAPNIKYDNISFERNDSYGNLRNLTIDNCAQLMNDPNWVLNWITKKVKGQETNLTLTLGGINWEFLNSEQMGVLEILKNVKDLNITGKIKVNGQLKEKDILLLKEIFGNNCFEQNASVYIEAPKALFITPPSEIWEGNENDKFKFVITTIGVTNNYSLNIQATAKVRKEDGTQKDEKIDTEHQYISVDTSRLSRGEILVNVKESDVKYISFKLEVSHSEDVSLKGSKTVNINKRQYPQSINITTDNDITSFNMSNGTINLYSNYLPENINNKEYIGRGYFKVDWSIVSGSTGYDSVLTLSENENNEDAYIKLDSPFNGVVRVKAIVKRIWDEKELASTEKEFEFTDPNIIITKKSNEKLYNILKSAGIITENGSGFGSLSIFDASLIHMSSFIDKETGKSIFMGNTELTTFNEFKYFTDSSVGAKPGEYDTTIIENLFSGCTNLREITIPRNFVYCANNMFNGCTNLEHIYAEYTYDDLPFEHISTGFAFDCKKLKTCNLGNAVHIDNNTFCGCVELETMKIGTSLTAITYSNSENPFKNCKNMTFVGNENKESAFFVIDGACYKNNQNNTLDLIHMGVNTQIAQIPTDKYKNVYTCAYSMEYRTESDIVIPSNIIFNGQYTFYKSSGNSIRLENGINDKCAFLFANTSYKGNYKFKDGETIIPSNCFYGVSDMESYTVPDDITTIGTNAFYTCKINDITLPRSLTQINSQSFWLTNLKTITLLSKNPPLGMRGEGEDIFFGVMLDNIYVMPDYFNNYYNSITELYKPFIKPNKLYSEGYIRIIKDGSVLLNGTDNISIKVGNATITSVMDGDYTKYTYSGEDNDIRVFIKDEDDTDFRYIGEILSKYTTIYLGDNSSLFNGNGLSFECGIPQSIKEGIENRGWFYDARFKGIRSNPDTLEKNEIILQLPYYYDKNINIKYGNYSYMRQVYVENSSNNNILTSSIYGFNMTSTTEGKLDDTQGTIKVGITSGTIKNGINGMVINTIGDIVYSDPLLIGKRNTNIKQVQVKINNTPSEIPKNVYVTLTDNEAFTYRKLWTGEPLLFNIPINHNFTASVSNFITSDGKYYYIDEPVKVNNDIVELTYSNKTGIEIIDNILCYYTDEQDWYVYLNQYSGIWSNSYIDIPENSVSDILISDTNGMENTININKYDENSICKIASETIFFDNIKGYIPSYIEMEIFSNYLPEINDFLIKNSKSPISLDNCWVSETYDSKNTWNTDGNYYGKKTEHNYYIFGKKIMS